MDGVAAGGGLEVVSDGKRAPIRSGTVGDAEYDEEDAGDCEREGDCDAEEWNI
jgi:hypothetical protein